MSVSAAWRYAAKFWISHRLWRRVTRLNSNVWIEESCGAIAAVSTQRQSIVTVSMSVRQRTDSHECLTRSTFRLTMKLNIPQINRISWCRLEFRLVSIRSVWVLEIIRMCGCVRENVWICMCLSISVCEWLFFFCYRQRRQRTVGEFVNNLKKNILVHQLRKKQFDYTNDICVYRLGL